MKEKDIKLSIVCTAYNHEKYIRSALDGFVMQKTNFAFEAIVHDDASTDGTADIIREYAKKYPDIIVPIIQTENQHSKKVQITREIIFPMIKGKYIAFCEGDDYWTDPYKLQKWKEPIYYIIDGKPTEEDSATLLKFNNWLNTIEGFPGIYETKDINQNSKVILTDFINVLIKAVGVTRAIEEDIKNERKTKRIYKKN